MARNREIEIISRGVLIENGKVLLCQNKRKGYWYLPGGHVEFGEGAAMALVREFNEETGVRVRAGKLLLVTEGTFRRKRRESHELNLVFHVERSGRDEIRSLEPRIAFGWFPKAGLSTIELRPGLVASWLRSANWRRLASIQSGWRSDV